MPCNQRRFRSHCGRGGPGGHGGGRCGRGGPNAHHFHSYRHMLGAGLHRFHPFFVMHHDEDDNEVDLAAHILNEAFQVNNKSSSWDETEESYSFQMDVPGVKAHHVTVEEKDGEIEVTAIRMNGQDEVAKTFQEILYVRPTTSDLTKTVATLNDGVLTITVPKKKDEPIDIPVEGATPPVAAEEGKQFRVSTDMPGVKIGNVKLQAHQGKVYLEASRKVGDRDITIRRIIEVQPSNTDMGEACAFLQDGVLTVVAPIPKNSENNDEKSTWMRTITVTTEEDGVTSPEFASLRLDDGDKKEGEEDKNGMIVETVPAEEKDWEEVVDDAKKPAEKCD